MFRYPPTRWAKNALVRRELRIAAVLLGMFAVPALFGSMGSFDGSDATQELSLSTTAWNRSATTLESAQLSQLKAGALPDRDFSLGADVRTSTPFIWPAYGDITSYMDGSHPMGIDIGLDNDHDSPVVAAAGGTVTYAGGGDYDNYGYYVKIDHGSGLVTLYAHLSEILVSEGQALAQGEMLGYGGSTGKSSGKHLHLEVRQGNFLVDPLELLPPGPEAPPPLALNCDTGVLVLDRGGLAELDFVNGMPSEAKITSAVMRPHGAEAGLPAVALMSDKVVRIETAPHIEPLGLAPDAWYGLDLVIEGSGKFEKSCDVQVRTVASAFVPYSDASVVASSSGSPYEEEWVAPTEVPVQPVEAPAQPVEATAEPPPPSETPLVVPEGIPMLGDPASPTPSPTPAPPTPQPTETPTATQPATATPEDTSTSVPPTATPEPTTAPETTTPSSQ